MLIKLREFLQDETGPELVEWAVVTVVLLLATGVLLSQIYDRVIEVMTGILVQLTR
jgi:Flp pilus assembly pilin Flp